MDGHHSFSFSWDATHPNYNQPMHRHALNPLEGSSRTALAAEPNAYEVLQYRTTPQTPYGEGDGVQPNNNLKDQAGLQLDQEPDVTRPQPTVKPSRRAKYLDLDWNANRVAIKGLYIDQNKSLSETIEIMKDRHGFDAS